MTHSGRYGRCRALAGAMALLVSENFAGGSALAQTVSDAATVDDIVIMGRRRTDRASGSDPVTERMSHSSIALDRAAMDAYGVRRLADALELASGISQQNNLGGLRDNYAIRGFLGTSDTGAEYFVDGFVANRGFGPPRDPATIERIEVLKGPAGAVFGSIDPAGLVSITTKKPSFRDALSATASVGSFGTYRIEADGEFRLGDTIAVRLVGAFENSKGWRDHVDLRRRVVAPSVSWRPAPDTSITYQGEYIVFRAPFDRGIPAIGNDSDAVSRRRFLGEPGDGRVTSENWRHQLTTEQALGEGWALAGGVAYRHATLDGYSSEASTLLADGNVRRQRRLRDWRMTDLSGRIELRGTMVALGTHRPSVGVTAYDLDFDTYQERFRPSAAAPYPINVFNPVYGGLAGALTPFTDTNERRRSVAFYAQDMWEVTDRLSFVGGARYDRLDQLLDNRRTGTRSPIKRDPVDFRLGVRYRPDPRFAFHANWGEGFRANSGVGRLDNAFAPETGNGYEIGAKMVLQRVRAAVTWFRVAKSNILAGDPVDPNFLATVGKVRSRGIEIDGEVELTRQLRLIGNYAFVDAKASDPAYPTGDVLNVPRHSGMLQVFASLPIAGRNLDLGLGGTYVGPRAAALDGGNLRLDGYVKAKASAVYALSDRVTARVEIDNLLDSTYMQSSYSALWIYPGAPRSVLASLTFRY